MIRVLLSAAVALIMIGRECEGQTADSSRARSLELLAIPEGQPIMCRAPQLPANDPRLAGMVSREFRFGVPTAPIASWPRQIRVVFDSAGHPSFLYDAVNQVQRLQAIAAHLTPDGKVKGYNILTSIDTVALADAIARGDAAAAEASARPPVSRDLLPSEAARVRPLATWLWEHRCGRADK